MKKLLSFELRVITEMYIRTHPNVDTKTHLQTKFWKNKGD